MTTKEDKDREKVSRETLGKFFFDMAKTCFAAFVVSNGISMFLGDGSLELYLLIMVIGITSTSILAYIGYKILKNRKLWE